MPEKFLNYIDGKWVPARSGKSFFNHNPATGEILGEFPSSSFDDVNDAADAAAKAFRSWRLVPAPKRAEILYRAGEIIRDRKEELARAMTREMGKVLAEARGDVQEGIDMAYLAAGEGRRMYGVTTPSEMPNKWAMSVRVPVGRGRRDHAVELPVRDPVVEDHAGAGRGQHRGVQARRRHARDWRGTSPRSSRKPACRPAC